MANDSKKRYNNVLEIIEKRLIPDETAKKARGEVFTPLNLVREMLYGLRKSAITKNKTEIWGINENGEFFEDDEKDRIGGIPLELFRNSDSKWLDPANGIGNFPIVAFYMLDYQLNKHGSKNFKGDENTKKRQTHIIENMLYMVELNKGNVNTAIKIFKLIAPNATPNICCTNTLTLTDQKLITVFKVNRFDVIMGNPPFQAINEEGVTKSGVTKLYQQIIIKCLDFILQDGFMIFVIPNNLFSGNKITGYSDIIKRHVVFINTNDISDKHWAKIGQDTLYFLLQNSENKTTEILDSENTLSTITLEDVNLNPIKFWNAKTDKLCKTLLCNTKKENEKDKEKNKCGLVFKYNKEDKNKFNNNNSGKYKIMYKIDEIRSTNNEALARDKMYGIPKLIIFRVPGNGPLTYLDSNGHYGFCGEGYNYEDKNKTHLENLEVFFNSKICKLIRGLTMTAQHVKNPDSLNINFLLDSKTKLSEKDIYDRLSIKESDIDPILTKISKPSKSKKEQQSKTEKKSKAKKGGAFNKTRKTSRS